ncbi:MAG: hypothetical protein U9M98_00345 [Patescibacteria group bacterium]|nr:hypothetical protein [Patescibacteria group bacterium]
MDLKDIFFSRAFFVFVISFSIFFFSWFFVCKTGINDTAIQSHDTLPALFIPASVSVEGNLDLDEYFEMLISEHPHPDGESIPFYLRVVDGHFYSAFPVITGLLAIPVYFVPLQLGLPVTFETVALLGHISASFIVALSAVFIYLIFRRMAVSGRRPVILALVYALGTCSFALTSQGLWQHTASQLMLSLALYFLVLGFDSPNKAPWSGLFLSLATLARPTGAVAVLLLSLYFLLRYSWVNFLKYVSLGLFPVAVFLAVPGMHKGVFAGYASQVGSNWTAPFPQGFLGVWFSPSKGVLIYSPVFLFSFVSVWILVADELADKNPKSETLNPKQIQNSNDKNSKRFENLNLGNSDLFRISDFVLRICRRIEARGKLVLFYFVFLCVFVHSFVVGKWYHWYGGWAFGYRMMSDMIPFLAFLWVPFVKSEYWNKLKYWFYLAAVWSVGIQLAGIAFFDGVWHNLFDEGPDQQAWLWSVKNSEMLYYVRRLIAKLQGKPTSLVR